MAHHHLNLAAFDGLDPLAWTGFLAVASFSVLASLHCALMCAPLVVAARAARGPRRGDLWLYNLGRCFSYSAAGALLGVFGGAITETSEVAGKLLAVFLAIFLLTSAIGIFRGKSLVTKLLPSTANRLVQRTLRQLHRVAQRLPSTAAAFGLGGLTVLLPCMTLTPMLALAAASGSAAKGALLLLGFYLGTVPAMVIAPLVPHHLAQLGGQKTARRLAVFFLAVAAFVTLLRVFH